MPIAKLIAGVIVAAALVFVAVFVVLGERIPQLEPERPVVDAVITLSGREVTADVTTDLPDGAIVSLEVWPDVTDARQFPVSPSISRGTVRNGRLTLGASVADWPAGVITASVIFYPWEEGQVGGYGARGEGMSGPNVGVDTEGERFLSIDRTFELSAGS
jgi:hypothetical protein